MPIPNGTISWLTWCLLQNTVVKSLFKANKIRTELSRKIKSLMNTWSSHTHVCHHENKLINSESKNYMTANYTTQKIKCRKAQSLVHKSCDEWICSMSACFSLHAAPQQSWGIRTTTTKIICLHPWAYCTLIRHLGNLDKLLIFKCVTYCS